MSKKNKTIISCLIYIIIILTVLFSGIEGYHKYQNYQKRILYKEIIEKKYKHHQKLWKNIQIAKKHPTANNLSKLTITRPWKKAIMFLNHNKSTLNPKTWYYDHIDFSHPDYMGRISYPATAYLKEINVTGDALRIKQRVKPIGWHQKKYNDNYTLNRGHLIAYSLTKNINFYGQYDKRTIVGNQNDTNNLFTETAFCNQQLQYSFEILNRIALEHNKKIIYQAQPIFRNNEIMARGIHLQAISTDKKFQFNVYCFNVQPGIKYNYMTGQPVIDKSYHFKVPKKLIKHSEHLDDNDKYMKLQRKIMYLYQNHHISYKRAKYYESKLLGKYIMPTTV